MELEHSQIATNGINLHVVQAGPKSGIPVILLHGFPESWRCWVRQIPALAEAGCRVIVPDQRGYNLSDKPTGAQNYKVDLLVKDVRGLIDALDYEKVNLVGHDWGAIVAWHLASQSPERLHRLGIMNVPHPAVMRRFLLRDLEQIRRSWYVFYFQLPWLPEAIFRALDWRTLARGLRSTSRPDSFTDEDLQQYRQSWSQPGAITAMVNWYRAAVRYQLPVLQAQRIKVRTLMMWGMQDFALTHRMARPSMDYVDDGNLILFPEATHWVQRDAADEVNHYLIDFLLDKIGQQVIR